MHNFLVYWLPVLAWMALIFLMSTSRFSMGRTAKWIEPLLKFLFRKATEDRITRAHIRIREGAHFLEYLVLSVLVFRALRADAPGVWQAGWMWLSLLLTGAYGFADEWHQKWEAGRTARLKHALINVAGGVAGQSLIWIGVRVGLA